MNDPSSNDDDPVWHALRAQLPPWMRNPKNPEKEPEAVWNAHCSPVVDLKAIVMALEKDDQGKDKASNATEERGDAQPAVGVVKPGVVGTLVWAAGRYVLCVWDQLINYTCVGN